jgi:hypothetical protein
MRFKHFAPVVRKPFRFNRRIHLENIGGQFIRAAFHPVNGKMRALVCSLSFERDKLKRTRNRLAPIHSARKLFANCRDWAFIQAGQQNATFGRSLLDKALQCVA